MKKQIRTMFTVLLAAGLCFGSMPMHSLAREASGSHASAEAIAETVAESEAETKEETAEETMREAMEETMEEAAGEAAEEAEGEAAEEAADVALDPEMAFALYNGYAWMTEDGLDSCYNAKGELLFTLPEGTKAASVFYNGYAAVMQKNEWGKAYVTGLVDETGEVVLDAEMIGVDGFIFGIYENQPQPPALDTYERENRIDKRVEEQGEEQALDLWNDFETLVPVEDSLLEDGYILAYTFSESYSGVDFEVGMVDMQGSWVMPLQAENIATLNGWYSPGAFLRGSVYCKENTWMSVKGSMGSLEENSTLFTCKFYNSDTNTWAESIGDNFNVYSDTFGLTFEDGTAIAVGSGTEGMSYITLPGDGKSIFEPENRELESYCYFIHYDREAQVIYAYKHDSWNPDENGVIILDKELNELAKVNLSNFSPAGWTSSKGYLPVNITNPKGTEYWGIICPDGEFLFEPLTGSLPTIKKFEADGNYLVFWTSARYVTGLGCLVYDLEGNELCHFDPEYDAIEYHNGVLKLTSGGNEEIVPIEAAE